MKTVLMLILMLLMLSGHSQTNMVSSSKPPSSNHSGITKISKTIASNYVNGNFASSLDAMENSDFILTPALLVQEVISSNVVIAYPNE